ncbi:Hsp20-like protein [Salicola phage SCTP-2]|nr:Hsp20-like protein [Salicola phage SCTP-2]
MKSMFPTNTRPTLFDELFNLNTSGFFENSPMTTSLLSNENDNFPPVDITSLDNNNNYYIRLSVAGYNKDEIDISINENNQYAKVKSLTVEASKTVDENGEKISSNDKDWNEHINNKDVKFFKRGIANRNFTQNFMISKDDEVENCKLDNGILLIKMKRTIPENKDNVKRIEIS